MQRKTEPNVQKYKLLGNEIERVSEEKDIGVTIDEELTFEKHAQEKSKKANSTFAAIPFLYGAQTEFA
jgi:1-aminocyclopropane-1-carboxylate deaminase/D-cysteine desulfhydrase-like pyridoxal-dependent ACC family enzyme